MKVESVAVYDPFFEAALSASKKPYELFWAFWGRQEGSTLKIDRAKLVPRELHSQSWEKGGELDLGRFFEWERAKRNPRWPLSKRDHRFVGLGHVHRSLPMPTINDTEYLSKVLSGGIHSIYYRFERGGGAVGIFKAEGRRYLPVEAEILNQSKNYQDVRIVDGGAL